MINEERIFDLRFLGFQYFLALLILSVTLCVLYLSPISRISLDLPDKYEATEHPWSGGDTITYVEPAKSFLETGVFLREGKPDIHRTIGYPFFLAVTMKMCGEHWMIAAYLIQLVLAATIFPSISLLGRFWFGFSTRQAWQMFCVLAGCGIAIAYVGILLTDQIFTSLLILGIALGVAAIIRQSWMLVIIHILAICWAAQIRPTLSFFWIVEMCFMLYTCRMWEISFSPKITAMLSVSVVCVAIAGSAPAIRNYVNRDVYTPTDVLSNNLAYYLAGNVLLSYGKNDEYLEIRKQLKSLDEVERIAKQNEFAKMVIKEYPFGVLRRIAYHAVWNLYEPHWEYLANVFGSGFQVNDIFDKNKKIYLQLFFVIPFFFIYSALYLLVTACVYDLVRNKDWLLCVGLLIFLLPLAASLINGQGARMRLCVEPLLVLFAFRGIDYLRGNEWNKYWVSRAD